ncbi:MAG: multiheme c-type cytochrome [Pirellulales bacterium]
MRDSFLTHRLWLPILIAASSCACNLRGDAAASRGVSLVVSGDTAGWITPCGCASRQSGGLARRGAFVERCRQTDDVVVADVGGTPSGASPYDVEKFTAILRGEMAMGTSAHNVGGAEAELGPTRLRAIARQTGAPLVSANARDADGGTIAPAVRVVAAGGRRLAIVGVLSRKFATQEIRVAEPAAAVLEALEGVQGGYDVAVVLAYLPPDELELLARAVPEADLIVGGPTIQTLEPRRFGPTLLAAVTNKGKFVARFRAPGDGASRSWRCEIVEMDDRLPDDARQLENLARFRQTLRKRDFTAGETSFRAPLPAQVPDNYHVAGTNACRQCHQGDCNQWSESKHALAWATLEKRAADVDPFCQQCHTTGYGLPGGFASKAKSAERVAVGCESCHGPATAHATRPEIRTTYLARDQCLRCHDRENSPAFAYDDYWQRIRHGNDPPADRPDQVRALTKEIVP